MKRLLITIFFLIFSGGAYALEETTSKSVGIGVPGAGVSILQWLLSCVGVIFLMFFLAYLLKKARFVPGLKGNLLKIEAMIGVGSHEKLAIVKAGSRYYLIGITPQKITQLGEIDASELNSGQQSSGSGETAEKGNFAEKLFAFMVRGRNGTGDAAPETEKNSDAENSKGENNENN